jgi:hypothetical protein
MKIEDFKPTLQDIIDHKSQEETFIAIARVDSLYAGRDRVSFVQRKNLTDFGYTGNIWYANNFYTVEDAHYFMRTRLKTAIAKRNKLVTAFCVVELKVNIVGILE